MPEIWKDVVGYEGRYQVSSLGRIKSFPNQRRHCELIMKPTPHVKSGHLVVNLHRTDVGKHSVKMFYLHRLILEAFEGPAPAGMIGCHNDGDVNNNHYPSNLRWGTYQSNQLDREKHGTSNIGEQNPRAKLNSEKVAKIKRRLADGESYAELAVEFGVSRATVHGIREGKVWEKVEMEVLV